ncbi:extracellular solute-binding protein [Clostridium sp. MCC353]|uniref:extracellular solute-binding protein n=1 Tax=Clostridium sp. MCC353 TaxID=2592646 RepID=UPI001C013659|nr:extracellular solute-binding protein [Clostridium sp. MCC353]
MVNKLLTVKELPAAKKLPAAIHLPAVNKTPAVKKLASGCAAGLLALALAGCGGRTGLKEGEIIYTMGRQTQQNTKMPEGDTYEDNAYTRLVRERLNAVCIDDFEATGDAYERQVSLSLAAGDLPDFMKVGNKDLLDELVENDLAADLTDVYENYASGYLKEVYDSYGSRCLDAASYNGRLMALPGTNLDSAPNILWVRADWLETLDLPVDPEGDGRITLDELELMAEAFMEADPDGTGNPVGIALAYWLNANDYGSSTYCMTGIAGALGAFPRQWMEDGGGNIVYGSVQPETKEALSILHNWFEQGIVDPQFGTRTWDDITALLTNGQTGIAFGVWHIPDWLLNSVHAMHPQARLKAFVLEDEEGRVNVFHNNPANGYIVVRKGYEHPELAVQIANLFYDELVNEKDLEHTFPEAAAYLKNGVDGSVRPFNIEVNKYTSLLDDYEDIRMGVAGQIAPEEAKTAESQNVIKSIRKYLEDPQNAETGDWSKYHSRMEGIELIRSLTKSQAFSWTEPAFWGTTKTMETKWANLQKLEEETFIKLITGDLPMEAFEQFVESWYSQGGAEIILEIEEQRREGGEN